MPVTDADLNLVFQYLDGELTDGEEHELLQRMQQHPELQQAFDQQVLMSAYLVKAGEPAVTATAFESADDHLNRISNPVSRPIKTKIVILPAAKKRWQPFAAAAAVAAIILVAVLYFSGKRNTSPGSITKTPERITPATKDSTRILPDTSHPLADVILPEKLYEEFATPLADNDMQLPIAARPYQSQYKQGRYTELTEADESDVITKGTRPAGEERAIVDCFNFYKALSHIELKQPVKAEALLQKVLAKSQTNIALSNHATWYLLLLYLKANHKPEALRMAASIAESQNNPYRKRAVEIVEKLGR